MFKLIAREDDLTGSRAKDIPIFDRRTLAMDIPGGCLVRVETLGMLLTGEKVFDTSLVALSCTVAELEKRFQPKDEAKPKPKAEAKPK